MYISCCVVILLNIYKQIPYRKHLYFYAYINPSAPNQFSIEEKQLICEFKKNSDGVPLFFENVHLFYELSNFKRDFWAQIFLC